MLNKYYFKIFDIRSYLERGSCSSRLLPLGLAEEERPDSTMARDGSTLQTSDFMIREYECSTVCRKIRELVYL